MTPSLDAAYAASQRITKQYSTSFTMSIRLFPKALRPHIYAVYGLVRVADELVDTYRGPDAGALLDALEHQTYDALKTGESEDPIVHAFAATARRFGIDASLIKPFFTSMRMDLTPQTYTQKKYETYIIGSAEVVGLMCLKIFTKDESEYKALEPAARHLGAAYQKINFLRDIAADHAIGRWYFPSGSFETFDETHKQSILDDIQSDFDTAAPAIQKLPSSCRKAVTLSKWYYQALLDKIRATPAEILTSVRIRVPDAQKVALLVAVTSGVKR